MNTFDPIAWAFGPVFRTDRRQRVRIESDNSVAQGLVDYGVEQQAQETVGRTERTLETAMSPAPLRATTTELIVSGSDVPADSTCVGKATKQQGKETKRPQCRSL